MKLQVDFSGLWLKVRQMGPAVELEEFVLTRNAAKELQLDKDLSDTGGTVVPLDEIEADNAVLSYQGRQILLFIDDHGMNVDAALENPIKGRRYHVAECKTLVEMRSKNRFGRYRATNNLQGKFLIHGVSQQTGQYREGEAALKVCKNCLEFLNYQGFRTDSSRSKQIHAEFDIAQFLSHYSTLFPAMPPTSHFVSSDGYTADWPEISNRYRQSVNYVCECCSVDLSQYKYLLHTHHINRNKLQNDVDNLRALCIDCHRKQPKHEYMRVKHEDMLEINRLRRKQCVFHDDDWAEALDLADTSVRGVLLIYQKMETPAPVIGYELTDSEGAVIAQVEAAWPDQRFGLVISAEDYNVLSEIGWNAQTVGTALTALREWVVAK